MTCREKLAKEHPECVGPKYIGGCKDCPHVYNYLNDPEYCPYGLINEIRGLLTWEQKDKLCAKCWDREITDEKHKDKTELKPNIEDMCNEFIRGRAILMCGGFTSKEATDILQRLAYAFFMN